MKQDAIADWHNFRPVVTDTHLFHQIIRHFTFDKIFEVPQIRAQYYGLVAHLM